MSYMSRYFEDLVEGLADQVSLDEPKLVNSKVGRFALEDAIGEWILDNDLMNGESLVVPGSVIGEAYEGVPRMTKHLLEIS